MLLKHTLNAVLTLVGLSAALVAASQPWKSNDPRQWTPQDVERILGDSPWAQSVGATFSLAQDDGPAPPAIDIPQAGMPNPHNAATDGHWDGGVARATRNGPPTLNVTVRWESALPIQQALTQQHAKLIYSPEQVHRDYIIAVIGLVQAGHNPEEMLGNVMRYSRLYTRGKNGMQPEDAKLDTPSGTLYLFFPRTDALSSQDKEVVFETRFGSLSVLKRFRLKDMVYRRQLEL